MNLRRAIPDSPPSLPERMDDGNTATVARSLPRPRLPVRLCRTFAPRALVARDARRITIRTPPRNRRCGFSCLAEQVTETFLTDELAERSRARRARCPRRARCSNSCAASGGATTRCRCRAAPRCAGSPARRARSSPRGCSASPGARCSTSPRTARRSRRRATTSSTSAARGATLAFPEPDKLPYDPASPHPGITAQRLETLGGSRGRARRRRRRGGGDGARVLQRVPAPGIASARAVLELEVGGEHEPATLIERLVFLGYERLPEVEAVGQFARARRHPRRVGPLGAPIRCASSSTATRSRSLRRFDPAHAALDRTAAGARRCCRATRWWSRPSEAADVLARLRARRATGGRGAARPRSERMTALFHDGMERFAGALRSRRSAPAWTTCRRTRSWCSTIRASSRERAG